MAGGNSIEFQWLEETQLSDTNDDNAVDFYDLRTLYSEGLRNGHGLQADFNGDRSNDSKDFLVSGSELRRDCCCLLSDFNQDGHVNFRDFSKLTSRWLWKTG